MDITTRVENPVHIQWKPQGDVMVLNLRVGTWSDSDIKLSKSEVQTAISTLTNWLKGGDTSQN